MGNEKGRRQYAADPERDGRRRTGGDTYGKEAEKTGIWRIRKVLNHIHEKSGENQFSALLAKYEYFFDVS